MHFLCGPGLWDYKSALQAFIMEVLNFDIEQVANIQWHCWKEYLEISEMAKYLLTSNDLVSKIRETTIYIHQMFVWQQAKLAHLHAKVCTIYKLCRTISLLLQKKWLTNLALFLIFKMLFAAVSMNVHSLLNMHTKIQKFDDNREYNVPGAVPSV